MQTPLDGKPVLITGGTGSLGQAIVRRLLTGELGHPKRITVLSRDEAKQYYMRLAYLNREVATDDIVYRNFQQWLSFRIGNVRDHLLFHFQSLLLALFRGGQAGFAYGKAFHIIRMSVSPDYLLLG